MSIDLRLLAIVDPAVLGSRPLVDAARAAQAGGATALQLRMKGASGAELFAATSRLVASLDLPVFVNDRADVALAAGATGVHLGQDDTPAALLRAVAPAPFRIGLSVGTPAEAEAAASADVDYWSIGPLYRTASKADAGVPLGPAGFADLARRGMPVIAIGGITAANAAEVMAAGAAGVAVISAIFGATDIERATRAIRDAIDRALL